MIYTVIVSLLIEEPFYLLSPQSFSFQIVSEFIDIFVKTKIQNSFFVQFQAPFSQKININIHLYISYKAFICSIVGLW